MFFLGKRGKLFSLIFEMIRKRIPKNQKVEELKQTVEQTAENVAFITYQVKEIEPIVEEVQHYAKRLENELSSVKKSYERIYGPIE